MKSVVVVCQIFLNLIDNSINLLIRNHLNKFFKRIVDKM